MTRVLVEVVKNISAVMALEILSLAPDASKLAPVGSLRIIKSVMENNQIVLGKYQHFKGKEYEVLGVGKHSETLEDYVVYRALYGEHGLWIRPFKMFIETVEVEGKQVPRFRLIT